MTHRDRPDRTDPVRVGVLSLHDSKETKAILNAVEGLGADSVWLDRETTSVHLIDGALRLEPDVDVVVNRLLLSKSETPSEDLGMLRAIGLDRPVLNDARAVGTAVHKFAAAAVLAARGVPTPDAVLAASRKPLERHATHLGGAAVVKPAIGTNGAGVERIGAAGSIPTSRESGGLLQRYLHPSGERHRDLRVYVVGDRVRGAMYRYAPEGEWRTNVALGGDVEDATWTLPTSAAATALAAVEAIGLDYAGVDLIEGRAGWTVLEVNPTAGFRGLYEATGRSVAPYIATLAVEHGGGAVDDSLVRELATELDDSVPDCARRGSGGTATARGTIGLTEKVVVTGPTGSKPAVATTDTGRSRTRIDDRLAGAVGAGSDRSAGAHPGRDGTPDTGGVDVTVNGVTVGVRPAVVDRGSARHPVLLGRDVLDGFRVDVKRTVEPPPGP